MNIRARAYARLFLILLKIAAVSVMATQASQKFVYGGF